MSPQEPILVTGASSGIGRMITDSLSRKGRLVYACARKKSDLEELNSLDNVISFRLDITQPSEVQDVVERVKEEGKGLYALVNNAGILDFWPIAITSPEMLHHLFEVNVYGQLRITNALISFLIESKGRIINISSASGLDTPLLAGAYSMSKHAIEAWSNALLQELKDYDVKVCNIEPINFKSDIVKSAIPPVKVRYHQLGDSLFKKEIEAFMNNLTQFQERWINLPAPGKVADAVLDALFSQNPKTRYFVANNQSLFIQGLSSIIIKIVHIFQDNEHDISRADLHKLLDTILDEGKIEVRGSEKVR